MEHVPPSFSEYGFYDTCQGDSGGPAMVITKDEVRPEERRGEERGRIKKLCFQSNLFFSTSSVYISTSVKTKKFVKFPKHL